MMWSAEWYYEEKLKGKSVEQIREAISKLEIKVCQLKQEVENPDSPEWMIDPDPEVQLRMYRLYLQKAKETLKKVAG